MKTIIQTTPCGNTLFVVVKDSLAFTAQEQIRIDDALDAGYRFAAFRCEKEAHKWIKAAVKNV